VRSLDPADRGASSPRSLFVELIAARGEADDAANFLFDVAFVSELGDHLAGHGGIDCGLRQVHELSRVFLVTFGQVEDESFAQRGF
jgi:hypothetical protein